MNYSIVIMAAGQGKRMRSNIPKVLHKLCGKSMIDYIIEESLKLSDDVNVVLYHQKDLIINELEKKYKNINITIQDHINYPGTGGAIRSIKFKNEKIVVLNGDMPLVTRDEIEKLANFAGDVVISSFFKNDPTGYGRVVKNGDEVIDVVEDKDCSIAQRNIKSVNAGVYSFSKEFLENNLHKLSNNNAQKEFYITELISIAKRSNIKVFAIDVEENSFFGVNSKYELSKAEVMMCNRIKKDLMDNGVIIHLPDTVYIESNVVIDGECEIESNVVLKGNSFIKNSIIYSGSVIEDAIVEDSTIGPMARVRPKSCIKNSHLGNFVETKKSNLNGVKAGHLSYLGDADIDEGTNVGAGTITCNYDGKTKHKTIIGKNVFIGSDVHFVAPITIENNVLIGAGTTVTKNAKEGELVLARSKQENKDGFYFKFFGTIDDKKSK